MRLRSIAAIGVTLAFTGQASALTCADAEGTEEILNRCGLELQLAGSGSSGMRLPEMLAQLQGIDLPDPSDANFRSGSSGDGGGSIPDIGGAGAASSSASVETPATPADTVASAVPSGVFVEDAAGVSDDVASDVASTGDFETDEMGVVPLPAGGLLLLGGLFGLAAVRKGRRPS